VPARPPESYTPEHLAERILSSKSALKGERKQVTVLFADLTGSMELLADRDPEEARKLLDPVLDCGPRPCARATRPGCARRSRTTLSFCVQAGRARRRPWRAHCPRVVTQAVFPLGTKPVQPLEHGEGIVGRARTPASRVVRKGR
jgi:hypothetical protein